MGFLEKLFGKGQKYPALAVNTSTAQKLEAMKEPLQELTSKVKDPMEVVPADDSAYVFIGNPPKNFGMAWIENGKVYTFKTLSEEKGIPPQKLLPLVDKLAEAYKRSDSDSRYSATIGDKVVTVTPSQSLAKEVRSIIANA
ncbi:MAG: hypothetical protein KJ950_07670 [Proteobacteria bacterium]|nr:hypothetical protein [Pseudomonadota bacterium]MBU1687235.1 hypothetical protein [Pseudomonadota bacterium]